MVPSLGLAGGLWGEEIVLGKLHNLDEGRRFVLVAP